jgi:hypothetical protein
VFVEEVGTNTPLSALYGWSRVGERLRARVPKNWGKNVTLLSSMSTEGKALSAESARDARGFFEHSGYRALAQPF